MKKTALILPLILLLIFSACATGTGNERDFKNLREAYAERGAGVEGFEVDKITEMETYSFFTVRICLNTEDATTVDDFVWFEANVLYFESKEDADAAYRRNTQSGTGGVCHQKGNILIYWMEGDYFEDLYSEVFFNILG